jgi:hypothetical protein
MHRAAAVTVTTSPPDPAREGEGKSIMATATCVKKTAVVATLRSRNLHGRADWVEKELPALIDTVRNASLLQTLGINVDALTLDARPDHSVVDSPVS